MNDTLYITNTTKTHTPSADFLAIKNNILGKKYNLSIALVGKTISHKLNKLYRQKNKPTNVLSFSLSKNSGELILCPSVIMSEVKKFEKNFDSLFIFLVIHGMLHLKGMEHGVIMEKAEQKYSHKYDKKYRSGHRRRNHDDQSDRGRIHKRRKHS